MNTDDKKGNNMSKELARLFKYLMDLELSGKVCVFINMSGHVNWFECNICNNKTDYSDKFGRWTIGYKDYDGKNIPASKIKLRVDTIIKEIEEILQDLDNVRKEKEEAKRTEELAQLERLKVKYEEQL